MTTKKIKLPKKLKKAFSDKARYRVFYGGRGSSKSWSVATMLVLRAAQSKVRILCARELQKSIKDSSHKLISDTIERMDLQDQFDVGESFIRHINGSDFIFKGLKHNAAEIKSTEGVDIAWIEEAQRISKASLDLLIPTIRSAGSELWFTYNPEYETDEIHQMFVVKEPPKNSIVVKINWDDNKWFPQELEDERQHCLKVRPDDYEHIWNGECKQIMEGYYYSKELKRLEEEGRFVSNLYDEGNTVRCAWDIGASDAVAIWFYQWSGGMIHFIDYYESVSEDPRDLVKVVNSKPYIYDAQILPHDANHKKWTLNGVMTPKDMLEKLGLKNVYIQPVTNSVKDDIYAVQMLFNKFVFDEVQCKDGIGALKNYHSKYDEERKIFSDKPYKDWSNHGSDACRYAAIDYHREFSYQEKPRPIDTGLLGNDILPDLNVSRSQRRRRI